MLLARSCWGKGLISSLQKSGRSGLRVRGPGPRFLSHVLSFLAGTSKALPLLVRGFLSAAWAEQPDLSAIGRALGQRIRTCPEQRHKGLWIATACAQLFCTLLMPAQLSPPQEAIPSLISPDGSDGFVSWNHACGF